MPWKIEITKSLIPVCGNTYTSSSTDITRKTRNPSCSGWKASFAYFCSSGPGMMIHTKHCKYQVKCSILIDFSRVLRRRVTWFLEATKSLWALVHINSYSLISGMFIPSGKISIEPSPSPQIFRKVSARVSSSGPGRHLQLVTATTLKRTCISDSGVKGSWNHATIHFLCPTGPCIS